VIVPVVVIGKPRTKRASKRTPKSILTPRVGRKIRDWDDIRSFVREHVPKNSKKISSVDHFFWRSSTFLFVIFSGSRIYRGSAWFQISMMILIHYFIYHVMFVLLVVWILGRILAATNADEKEGRSGRRSLSLSLSL
jgi:hypothetical protein